MPPPSAANLAAAPTESASPEKGSLGALTNASRAALATYAEDPSPAARDAVLLALRTVAETVTALPPTALETVSGREVRQLLGEAIGSGVHDAPAVTEDLARAQEFSRDGAAGLLAAMLLVPAWQWHDAPGFARVPPAIMGDYAAWVFAAPQGFVAPGQAELYPVRALHFMEDLLRFARSQAGSTAMRDALMAFLRFSCIPLYFCGDSLRRLYEVRARILQCATVRPAVDLPAKPRAGRRLRVGFINRHFGSQTETYTTLPTFEQLDPERFEVLLFATAATGSDLENYARSRAAELRVLPADPRAQVDELRAAGLDVAVFGTNVTAVFHEITRLALHRVAPLQVVNNSSCTTTGFPEIDVYVSGALTEAPEAATHFSERLALLPGPTHAFNYESDRVEPCRTWTRADLGLPEDAIVFVSAANYFKVIPEMRDTWARLLAAVPGSRLLLHPFNPNWSSAYPIKRFAAECDAALAAHGVATDRLVISSMKFPSRTDVKELLRVGDIYLDSYPFGGVNSLVDPLELGMPVVVREGRTFRSRMGAALLRSLGLEFLAATDEAGYLSLATQLAQDPAARAQLKGHIDAQMQRLPIFLDSLAHSEAFGALLEAAYDEVAEVGLAEFRRRRTVLTVATPPDKMARINAGVEKFVAGDFAGAAADARTVLAAEPANRLARHLMGATLRRTGRAARAAEYLLAAVQHSEGDAPLWCDLAGALAESGRPAQAVQALETSLRLDSQRLDGWLLLADLARDAKNEDLLQQALAMARQLAPDDPRVAAASPAAPVATKHILLYTDDPQHGGVAQYNHPVLLALRRAGHRVTCVQTASDSPLVQEQRTAGVRHVWLGYDTGKEFARTVEDTALAEKIFQAEKPDLIVFSDCCPVSNFAARQVAMSWKIPYVVVEGFVAEYLAKNFPQQLPALAAQYAAARAVVAVSQENLALLRRRFGLGPDQGEVVHYGRPEKFFAPRDETVRARLRGELKLSPETVVCFTAARLTAVKGFNLQLAAIKLLAAMPAAKPLHFVWAGDGDQRAAIEREIAKQGLGGRITLLGHRWDVADWFDAADIFILPSQLEGMPLAIMEAMAKGVPVIATAVSGIPEELGDTGKLLPNPATDAAGVIRGLVETLAAWAPHPALRVEQGRRCRERAVHLFREELMLERTLAIVNRALEPAPRSTPASAGETSPRGTNDTDDFSQLTAAIDQMIVDDSPAAAPEPASKVVSPADALSAQAREALDQGNEPRALQLAQDALQADGKCAAAFAVVGQLMLRKDPVAAENFFRHVLQVLPDDPVMIVSLAQALCQQRKLIEADRVLQRCDTDRLLAYDSNNEPLVLMFARIRESQQRPELAERILREWMQAHAPSPAVQRALGDLLKRQGRLTEALQWQRQSVGGPAITAPRAGRRRVLFISQHGPLWHNLASVYRAFADDPAWEATVVAMPNLHPYFTKEEEIYGVFDFLHRAGIPFVRWDQFELTPGCADVVFVPTPYEPVRPPEWSTANLVRLGLRVAYVPYCFETVDDPTDYHNQFNQPLQQLAWAVFARSETLKQRFARHCSVGQAHVAVTGHPKTDELRALDAARDPALEAWVAGRKMVIWNPHFDVRPDGSPFGGGYSTFQRWWKFLPEEFARRPHMAFVIRPHPVFFASLEQRGIFTRPQLDEFVARCAAAGNIQFDRRPSYLPVFASAAAMLSDQSTFLLEFPITGKPLLYLRNPKMPMEQSDIVGDFCPAAETETEIVKFLDHVAAGHDPRAAERLAAYQAIMHLPPQGVGVTIKQTIEQRLAAEQSVV